MPEIDEEITSLDELMDALRESAVVPKPVSIEKVHVPGISVRNCTFEAPVVFRDCCFEQNVDFSGCIFKNELGFGACEIGNNLYLNNSLTRRFAFVGGRVGSVYASGLNSTYQVQLATDITSLAVFRGAELGNLQIKGGNYFSCIFDQSKLNGPLELGGFTLSNSISFDSVVFGEHATVQIEKLTFKENKKRNFVLFSNCILRRFVAELMDFLPVNYPALSLQLPALGCAVCGQRYERNFDIHVGGQPGAFCEEHLADVAKTQVFGLGTNRSRSELDQVFERNVYNVRAPDCDG